MELQFLKSLGRKSKKNDNINSKKLAIRIAKNAYIKQAEDLVILDMRKACNFCDYFFIATANSSIHIKAITEAIEEDLDKEKLKPAFPSKEQINSGWVVLDYGSVIVHIFLKPLRQFYNLEHLWQTARKIKIPLKDF